MGIQEMVPRFGYMTMGLQEQMGDFNVVAL